MTITRDGKTYELTPLELRAAYYEQQHLFDVEDVFSFADMCDDQEEGQPYIDRIRDHEVAEEVADVYREFTDDCDSGWFDRMSDAVFSVCRRERG